MTTLYGVRQETLEAYLKAERAKVWEEAAKEATRIYQAADAAIEGCDGDELIRFSAIYREFIGYANWCRAQAAKETL